MDGDDNRYKMADKRRGVKRGSVGLTVQVISDVTHPNELYFRESLSLQGISQPSYHNQVPGVRRN